MIFPFIILDKIYFYLWLDKHKQVCIDIQKKYIDYDTITITVYAKTYSYLHHLYGLDRHFC